MNSYKRTNIYYLTFLLVSCFTFFSASLFAQVQLRDTMVIWQHHEFNLNANHSLSSYSTVDTDIEEVVFANGKVIENELIRLVVLPEYGARVISFYYKPTGHEYLYQSECGTPYEIRNGIFYYDWLMVYGGIFPTFPEPEHGKTWLLPWDYSIIEQTDDKVTVRMEYVDNERYPLAPGQYNNGITNLTCQIDISVYKNASIWDFDVNIINDQGRNVNYEYWTCTTLAPGSEIEDTGTPLNSEIVIPVEQYFSGWSPNSWIGNNNNLYDFDNINFLHEWDNMGIAYAHDFKGTFWGAINHENEEGIFRVSENIETKGVKLWTWGKDNIDNNLFDFSNGGADNYIELWAGVSESFFTDAIIKSNEQKSWKESYCATVNLSAIGNMNNYAGVNLIWEADKVEFTYELNTFHADKAYTVELFIEGNNTNKVITSHPIEFAALGQSQNYFLAELGLAVGDYTVYFELSDEMNNLVLVDSKNITLNLSTSLNDLAEKEANNLTIKSLGNGKARAEFSEFNTYQYQLFSLDGQLLASNEFTGTAVDIEVPNAGLFLMTVYDDHQLYTEKFFVP